jgi:hypothetical protein
MTLRSRIEKLESAQTTTRVRHWLWDSVPDRIEVDGGVFNRQPGESDDGIIARISRQYPQAEIVVFKWLASEKDRE